MKTATDTRETLIMLIESEIRESIAIWERGENASPDQMDFVLCGDRILTKNLPSYIGSTSEGREFLADEMYEDCGEKYVTERDLAEHIYDVLTAE